MAADSPFPVIEIMSGNDGRRMLHEVSVVLSVEMQNNGNVKYC